MGIIRTVVTALTTASTTVLKTFNRASSAGTKSARQSLMRKIFNSDNLFEKGLDQVAYGIATVDSSYVKQWYWVPYVHQGELKETGIMFLIHTKRTRMDDVTYFDVEYIDVHNFIRTNSDGAYMRRFLEKKYRKYLVGGDHFYQDALRQFEQWKADQEEQQEEE